MAIVRTTHRAARVGHDRARGEWADMAGCTGPADARGGPGGSPALPCLTGLAGRAAAGLLLALAVLAAIMPMRAPAQDKDAARAPNIVIVLADDLGYGDVGYLNSQSQIPTPNLDTLAGQGMAFLDAHSPSAVCTATRYGLLTGRYAWRTRLTRGVLDGYDGPLIAPNRETLGSFLGATGYRTAVIGKWHLGLGFAKNALGEFDFEEPIDDGPHTHGFDESYIIPASLDFPPYVYIRDGEITGFPLGQQSGMEFPRYMRAGELASDFDPADVLDELIRQATGFIQRQASDGSPFLLYLPLTAPHKPVWPAQRFEGTTELGPYGDFIVQVDAAVGDVMSALDQAGVDDNTLLIVTSDNGSFMSRLDGLDDRDHTDDSTIQAYRAGNHTANHVYRGTKADIWEGGHRVPFFARWPGQIEPGSTREEVISLTDVFATVAEIVGKELPNNAAEDSFSLLPLLRGNPWARPRAAVTHHSIQGMFAIRDGRWKLVAGNGSGGREDPIGQPFERPYQLFDIASDPSEQSNVYDQHPAVAQRLERELERIRSGDRSRMTTDMAALVALYNGTNGANWKTNTNWLSEAPLVSLWDWHGVTTDENGRVTELVLASNDLSGTIPAELGERNLTKLQRLDLSENELSGAIPLTLMTLSQLSVLDIRSTTLCAPADTAFQAWLATINFQGVVCADFEADENQTATGWVVAVDPDSGDGVAYAITGGADASKFDIGETTGVLTFQVPPNYERAADVASTDPVNGAGNNEYIVTVTATGGTGDRAMTAEQTVTVTVRNVEEAGTISFSQVGSAIRARLNDPDGGVNGATWQWARSSNRNTGWTHIGGATSARYTPSSGDQGMYLQATVSYDDAHSSGKQAQGISATQIAPPNLRVATLVSGLSIPWDIAFTPDGTMLFTQRAGVLSSRLADGTVQTIGADFGDLFASGEIGLMGIVVDPSFASNRRFYTCQGHTGPEIQVIAWSINTAYTQATRIADPLVGGLPASSGRHGGCRLRFGPEGYLWIATGDAASGTVPQDLTSLGGKVLRVDASTGAGAPTNPFAPSRVYTYGHRNVQGLALRPGTSQMWSVEHGPSVDDEINLLVAGRNYGWNPVPGYNEGVPMTDLVEYPDAVEAKWSSGSPTVATSGAIFLEGDPWGVWEGRLAVATLADSKLRLFEFTPDGAFVSQVVVAELDGTFGRLRTPMLGPDGALYVTTSNGGGVDRILRIAEADPVPVTLQLMPASISENGGVSTVTASQNRVSITATTVTVSAMAVNPAVPGDFRLSANKTLTITAGQTTSAGTVTITANNNTADTPNKTVRVHGTADNSHGVTDPDDEELTITDDDAAPVMTLEVNPTVIVEAGGSAMVTVEITNGVTFAEDQEIALSFAGTATQGTDYTVALESLTLTAGENSVATTVTAVQDRVDDDAETILITAIHGGGMIGTEQTITIIDDDPTTCSEGMAGTYPCRNVDLMSFLALADVGGGEANDIWGWTDSSTGKEYAILGRTNGTSFVDISDPVNPIFLGNLPPHSSDSTWRDVKVYADHAFMVTGADSGGMQVFDLTQLRMGASPPATFSETAHYSGFSTAHNLAINEDSGFAYAAGTNDCGGGLHMIDIQTPTSPTSAGCFSADGHTHDAQCVNYDGPDLDHQGKEICFNSNVDTLTILDVTNKAAPVMLSRMGYTGSRYAHQGWLTEDQAYFLLDDELDEKNNPDVTNTRTYMWDVSDLDAPAVIGFHDSTTTATDHNQYVKGKYTYQSNYQAGLRILDITDIANGNLVEEAFFDVYPGSDSPSFNGSWSNFPFFDSGIVIVSGIEQGLFVLRPNLVDGVKPALASAAVNGAALTLTYGEALDESSTPATDAFTVTVAGGGRTVTRVSVSGRVVTLTLASVVAHDETVTVSYSPGTNPIRDAVGNAAFGFSNRPVRNETPDTTAPRVMSITSEATHPTKDRFIVTIIFTEEVTGLTAGEIVVINGLGSNFAGAGASYMLDIEPSANIEDDVTVRVPADAAVDGANIGNVEGSETFAVDTRTPTVRTVEISSNPGTDGTYAAGDEILVTVTFSETVDVEGTPQLRLRVGSRTRTAGYLRGTDTAALVFGYEVADGDEDTDGVSIEAGRIALNGGTIEDEGDNPAELDHEAVAPQAGHKVDGVRPAFLSAAVDGASLTLTYGEALDGGSRPATGDFTVQVDGAGRSVSGVSVSGSVVILTLNPAVEHGDTGIRVSYTPGTRPIQDTVGNDVVRLSNESVTNTTGAPNTAPQITSPESFDVRENQAMVRRLAAGDTDPGDEVTGWSIVGGADRFQFSIASDTGVLSFRTAPDYEDPRDTDSSDPVSGAGDNEYVVTVEARSGTGARQLEMEQTIAVRVTDEREPPGVPEAPTFSGETADSLQASWSEPDNTGPALTDYDVQYREKGTGRFTDGGHEGPGLSLTLSDLKAGTLYEVQVRATNDEGTSDWSESGEGMTITPLTVQMTSDIEPPVEGPFMVRFSFSETVTGFSPNDIETDQDPACMDDQNTPVFCDPVIGGLETIDDRIFTASVTPGTGRVAHNYMLSLTVPAGRVSSLTGNKPNEEATLEVRVAPPGVTVPISSLGLTASAGNAEVRLSWRRPANTGGSPIIRYEYRHAAVGEEWGDWENVVTGARGVTVGNLVNDQEYVFEARAVNALGKGPAETAMETPVRSTGNGGGGGGGGGGGTPTRPTVNTDPAITTPGPFEVEENQTRVVRIEAVDTDPGDAIRSYAIAGGADGALFSIVAHTGVLSFREPPNFEAPADVGSTDPPSEAGDNEYIVVVRVASGPVARDRTVEQAFAVRVTDADRESPGAPGAPRLTLALEASLTVEWAEPENPGPPITDYDVQYREGTSGFFINAPHDGPGQTATLTGLEAATLYQVQVRASNEEGTGRWSEPGEGLTLAGPPAVLPFSVPDRGGISLTSQGTSPELRVGYGQVETDDGMGPPAGLAIFSSRVNGVLVSEAGVPAVPPVLEGRIFAETDGVVRTGLAMANPNDTTAIVAFFFTDSDGIDSGHGTFTLGPREQIAQFLDEAPFNGGFEMWGTFTFTADLPVAVIALRGFVNERSEFLMTTLPVAPIAVPTTGTVYFPLFADGGGWTTQVILVNPTHAPIRGSVQFFGSGSQTEAAAPATLTLADGRSGSAFTYAIPPRSATRLRTSNPAGPLEVGSVRAVPDPGQPAPSGVSIFAFQKDGTTVSEAGVPASTSGAAFRVYVEASGTPGQPHSVRSGIALTNTSDAPTTVSLELTALDGTATGLTESGTLPASGQSTRFIDEIFPTLRTPFSGILRIASPPISPFHSRANLAVAAFRQTTNERGDVVVTATAPSEDDSATTAAGLFFPLFVDSGGWTTQFILFSGSTGQPASGVIRFTGQDGQPLELSVAPTAAPTIP